MQSRTLYSSIQAVFAFVGTADAGTLYWAHRNGVDLPCTSGSGCDLVNASHWASIEGIPVSLIGLVGYIVLLFASVLKLTAVEQKLVDSLQWLILLIAFLGSAYSWYLQYVAAVFIGAFCIYCRISAITMTLLLASAIAERLTASAKMVAA